MRFYMKVEQVKITEVGPRDGFQSESTILKTEDKIDVINNLIDAGFQRIEVSKNYKLQNDKISWNSVHQKT